MRYQAVVTKEGRATLVHFPDCPGCHTQADPGEDVLALAQDALEGWLEAHLVQGWVPPLPSARKHRLPAGAELAEVPVSPPLALRVCLRVARHEAGLSQSALAKKVGVSQQQIAAIESPDSNLTLNTLVKVAEALGRELEIGLSKGHSRHRRAATRPRRGRTGAPVSPDSAVQRGPVQLRRAGSRSR
jgi:predicted RNase H-like HicB family nuclease/DNA-binding XRE family transcriptional regulator